MNLADNLKKLRVAKQLSLTELAALGGVSLGYYNKLERYVMKPSVELLIDLSSLFGLTIDEIVYLNDSAIKKVRSKPIQKRSAAKKPVVKIEIKKAAVKKAAKKAKSKKRK
ncbi:MAG: Helix-turn-helix domain [Bacteroidota bacterium]|nr:Helix-turn-helix domain [Bacteroidota bacterium]